MIEKNFENAGPSFKLNSSNNQEKEILIKKSIKQTNPLECQMCNLVGFSNTFKFKAYIDKSHYKQ